jgi:hypothetical protein
VRKWFTASKKHSVSKENGWPRLLKLKSVAEN